MFYRDCSEETWSRLFKIWYTYCTGRRLQWWWEFQVDCGSTLDETWLKQGGPICLVRFVILDHIFTWHLYPSGTSSLEQCNHLSAKPQNWRTWRFGVWSCHRGMKMKSGMPWSIMLINIIMSKSYYIQWLMYLTSVHSLIQIKKSNQHQ